nr:hypothetical protein [Rhodococcus sp. 4CII]
MERVLSAHPDITMVSVGAVPHSVKDELTCTYVVRATGSELTEDESIDFSAQHLAAYKRPRMVRFVINLPKTSIGRFCAANLSMPSNPESNHCVREGSPCTRHSH